MVNQIIRKINKAFSKRNRKVLFLVKTIITCQLETKYLFTSIF
jgi:hypothetical protein